MLIAGMVCETTWGIVASIPVDGISGLLLKGVVATLVSGGLVFTLFHKDVPVILEKVFKHG